MKNITIRNINDSLAVDPILAQVLEDGSLDFFEPRSSDVGLHPEIVPLTGGRCLSLVADQPVSRAWHAIFIWAFHHEAYARHGRWGDWPAFTLAKQQPRPGPVGFWLSLDDESEEKRLAAVDIAKVALEVANALAGEGADSCRRKHEKLAATMGIRGKVLGFS